MHGSLALQAQISGLNPYDYEELDIGAAAVGFSTAKLDGCKAMWVRFSGGEVRFRVDGQADPTAAVGNLAFDGDREPLSGAEAKQFKAIRTGSTNGKAHATYYK